MIQLNPKEKVKSQIKRLLCTKVSWKVLQASRRLPKHLSTLSFCLWTNSLTSPNSLHPEMPQALWNCILLAQSQSWPQPYWPSSFHYLHHISFPFLKVKHQATLWSYLTQVVSCRGNLWARLKPSSWYTSFLGSRWFPSVGSKCSGLDVQRLNSNTPWKYTGLLEKLHLPLCNQAQARVYIHL